MQPLCWSWLLVYWRVWIGSPALNVSQLCRCWICCSAAVLVAWILPRCISNRCTRRSLGAKGMRRIGNVGQVCFYVTSLSTYFESELQTFNLFTCSLTLKQRLSSLCCLRILGLHVLQATARFTYLLFCFFWPYLLIEFISCSLLCHLQRQVALSRMVASSFCDLLSWSIWPGYFASGALLRRAGQ